MPHTDIRGSRSLYVAFFLLAATSLFKDDIIFKPEKVLKGMHGRGPVDYALESRQTFRTLGVTEVKRDDFEHGLAQNMVQLEACLVCMNRITSGLFADLNL